MFSGTSLSSKKTNGLDQVRRPEKTYGVRYNKNIDTTFFGPLKLNLKYQHYGKHWDTHSLNYSTISLLRILSNLKYEKFPGISQAPPSVWDLKFKISYKYF